MGVIQSSKLVIDTILSIELLHITEHLGVEFRACIELASSL